MPRNRTHKYAAQATYLCGSCGVADPSSKGGCINCGGQRVERFDSKRELARWLELKLLERAGEVTRLRRQVDYPITINGEHVKIRSRGYPGGRRTKYVADFVYFADNRTVIEDVKGFDTPLSAFKRAVVEAVYGVQITVVR